MPLRNGDRILFGYATAHPVTGGLSWLRTTPLRWLDRPGGKAVTTSGRCYEVGREIQTEDVPTEGEEPWMALDLLVRDDVEDGVVPPISADEERDSLWLAAQKVSRHLGLVPPGRAPSQVERFLTTHGEAFQRLRDAQGGG